MCVRSDGSSKPSLLADTIIHCPVHMWITVVFEIVCHCDTKYHVGVTLSHWIQESDRCLLAYFKNTPANV